MKNVVIGIICSNEYYKEIEKSINLNYKGVYIKHYKIGDYNKHQSHHEDILLIEWDKFKKNRIAKEFVEKVESIKVYLTDNIPMPKEEINEKIKEEFIFSKFDSIKHIIGETKIKHYSQKTSSGFLEDIEDTSVISALMFETERTLITHIKENKGKILKEAKENSKILIISLNRWLEFREEKIDMQNNLKRYIFQHIKGNEAISYIVEDFVFEVNENIFAFKFSNVENPFFTSPAIEVIRVIDNIRKRKIFKYIIIDMGECDFIEYNIILDYSTIIIKNQTMNDEKTIKENILKEILESITETEKILE